MAPKKKYQVSLSYSGMNTYFVEAEDGEEAEQLARDKWTNGDSGENTGGEFEEIDSVEAELFLEDKFEFYLNHMDFFYADVNEWHEADVVQDVYEWLGITFEQYKELIESKYAQVKLETMELPNPGPDWEPSPDFKIK